MNGQAPTRLATATAAEPLGFSWTSQEERSRAPLPLVAPEPSSPPAAFQVAYSTEPEKSASVVGLAGPVDLDTLVQYALANNPEIQAARYHAWALRARVPQAASLPDPRLMTTVFMESIQTAAGPQDVVMSLSQRFPWFGKLDLRSQVAYHDAMAASARATAVELQVAERVKRAYCDLYFLQSAMTETRRLEPRLEDVIEIARTRYETNAQAVGLESVLQAQIELSKLKTRLVKLEEAKAQAQAKLVGILHLPPQTPIEAEAELAGTKVSQTVRLLVDLAVSHQPELAATQSEICRDGSAEALACREYWPDVTLSFNWHEIGTPGLSPVATGDDAYSLGVGVNLPLYRKRLDAAVREAQHRRASSARRHAAARDRFQAEVLALYSQFREHDRILAILESEIVPRAGQTLELSTEAYRTGRVGFQQLIDAYRTLLNYRIDYHQRKAAREQAIASLERAVGCAATSWPTAAENRAN